MPITQAELAKKWNLTPGRISQLVSSGMPLESIEAAEMWRAKRHQESGIAPSDHKVGGEDQEPGEEPSTINPDGSIEILERQRFIVKVARQQYFNAVKDRSPQQARLYASYDRTIETLSKLEKQARERAIMSREYIRTDHAIERFDQVLAEIFQMLEQGELEVAPEANPDEPGKAMKAFRRWKERVFATIAKSSTKAKDGLTE
jgi:hypothetical protein